MTARLVAARGVERVVHFTTVNGFTGILDCQAVKSRHRLPNEKRLEFIAQNNAEFRKDVDWLDYVNLSITHINTRFFAASTRWHAAHSWVVLGFDPTILTHEGVHFATTNNFYPSVRRAPARAGLEALFAPSIAGIYGNPQVRPPDLPENHTTCEQAEVLYPGELPLTFLREVYVRTDDEIDSARGQLAAMQCPEIPVLRNDDVYFALQRGKRTT